MIKGTAAVGVKSEGLLSNCRALNRNSSDLSLNSEFDIAHDEVFTPRIQLRLSRPHREQPEVMVRSFKTLKRITAGSEERTQRCCKREKRRQSERTLPSDSFCFQEFI